MDATTFERIKDRLAELGAVKAEGMDKRQLRGTPRGWLARVIARCGYLIGCKVPEYELLVSPG
jgi:hypothetical protein